MSKSRVLKKRIIRSFPRLTMSSFRLTSRSTPQYNCIAWAAGDNNTWWEPKNRYRWPGALRNDSIEAAVKLFEHLGFEDCTSEGDGLQQGYEKIAIYGDEYGYTHATKQLVNGKWSSKLGRGEDIEHDSLDSLTETEGSRAYGRVVKIMKKARS